MTSDIDLAWRVEEACLNAWPSPRQLLVHGYLLRATGGSSKRQNSLNPLRGSGAPAPAIAAGQALYAALGRRAIFRVPTIAPQMEPILAGGDYTVVDETCTLFRDLDDLSGGPDPAVRLMPAPDAEWLALRDAVNRADAAAARAFRDTVETLILPRAFSAVPAESGIGAFAFGVLDGDLLVIESVATVEHLRGRGHGKRAVGTLLHWARGQGARAACLQVIAANTPARALYRGLGFARELYRYHYRVGAEPA